MTSIHSSVVAFERKCNEQMKKPHGEQLENYVKQTGYWGSTNANGADGMEVMTKLCQRYQ